MQLGAARRRATKAFGSARVFTSADKSGSVAERAAVSASSMLAASGTRTQLRARWWLVATPSRQATQFFKTHDRSPARAVAELQMPKSFGQNLLSRSRLGKTI